jgi:hypothetical protein
MLVGSDRPACAFRGVQLRRVDPRGHKSKISKRHRMPFRVLVLCLSGQGDPPALFVVSSSGGLTLEVISQRSQKGTERLSEIFALCLSPQGKPPPLFVMSSSGGLTLEVISQEPKKAQNAFLGSRLMLVGSDQPACAFLGVQLQRVDPRGHKSKISKRHRTPFRDLRLMLVGSGRPTSAFRGVKYFFLKGSIVVLHCGLLCDKLLRYLL